MSNIKLFESKQIRSVWNESDNKWYFSVADVVETLTDTTNVRDYIKKMRKREQELNANWGTMCPPLELLPNGNKTVSTCNGFRMTAPTGKEQFRAIELSTDCREFNSK